MHMSDPACGIMGSNGVVGAGVPLAVGGALAAKTRKSGQVAVTFFGDSTTNQGAWHEGINLAAGDSPLVLTLADHGELVRRAWTAIGSAVGPTKS